MNSGQPAPDVLADAREETFEMLGAVAHYCRCAQMHLEVGDDPVTTYDISTARDYFKLAWLSFEPVRAEMRQRVALPEREPSQ